MTPVVEGGGRDPVGGGGRQPLLRRPPCYRRRQVHLVVVTGLRLSPHLLRMSFGAQGLLEGLSAKSPKNSVRDRILGL